MLEYRSERILHVIQVDQMETKKPLRIAQKILYLAEFCLKINRAQQAKRYPIV